jgi:hypothetical protein
MKLHFKTTSASAIKFRDKKRFIFQIASSLTTTSDRQINLTGGSSISNIYWQVEV